MGPAGGRRRATDDFRHLSDCFSFQLAILNHMLNQSPSLDLAFHALADPTRRAILARLVDGAASVSELARPLPMSMPAVLQHLAVLEGAGLVISEKVGRVRTCRVEARALAEAERWLHERRAEWERRLDRLEVYLRELKKREASDDA